MTPALLRSRFETLKSPAPDEQAIRVGGAQPTEVGSLFLAALAA